MPVGLGVATHAAAAAAPATGSPPRSTVAAIGSKQSTGARPQSGQVTGFGRPTAFGTPVKGAYSEQPMKPRMLNVEVTGPGSWGHAFKSPLVSAVPSHWKPGTPYWQS